MSRPVDDDLPAVLARAFVRAWQGYYLPERRDAVSEEIARPALAERLVALAKEGIVDEAALAEAGRRHLNSLSVEPGASGNAPAGKADGPPTRSTESATVYPRDLRLHVHVEGPHAKFLPQWRISWSHNMIGKRV
jgi:hypothetical protein